MPSRPLRLDLESRRPRVAYFGGSFDPVHRGHLAIARQVQAAAHLDEFVFLPARRSPFKTRGRSTAGRHRLAMLKAALRHDESLRIDSRELDRPGLSFTVDTMAAVRRERPDAELFFLIGRDHVATLPRWRRANRLAELVTFLVVGRAGDPRPELASLPGNFRTHFVATEPHPASSTDIRSAFAQGQPDEVRDWLPSAVADYARRNRLYVAERIRET